MEGVCGQHTPDWPIPLVEYDRLGSGSEPSSQSVSAALPSDLVSLDPSILTHL